MEHTISIFISHNIISPFKINKLLQNLPVNTTLSGVEIYLLLHNKPIDIDKIAKLLDGDYVSDIKIDAYHVLVSARIGTTSPWSSKATEILHNCGFGDVIKIERGVYYTANIPLSEYRDIFHGKIYDKMTEDLFDTPHQIQEIFNNKTGGSYKIIDILKDGRDALINANKTMGLALSIEEIDYLFDKYITINRNPTDVELMMFGQINSEHCRHKIFNATFVINGVPQDKTLFQLIKDTFKHAPANILVAYSDNSSVIKGFNSLQLSPSFNNNIYDFSSLDTHTLMKVETHNHPTMIAPHPGAATGSGGEIRDEGATGRGSKPKAGLTGYSVSNLNLDNLELNHDVSYKPRHIKSALDIMIEAPIGAASFNNEFGRPNLCGYFQSFNQVVNGINYGYHKPIMIAGGLGSIFEQNLHKKDIDAGMLVIALGGPGFLIGLGGGALSSMASGTNSEHLDFNSVQRANPEMERRAQEVISTCTSLLDDNPIVSIHDVGAGGLSNAVPELIHNKNFGGKFELRDIDIKDHSMSPLEIWCNESQERYVLTIHKKDLILFDEICKRENCPYSVIGVVTQDGTLTLHDSKYNNTPISLDMEMLFGKTPVIVKNVKYTEELPILNELPDVTLMDAIYKVISHPTVSNKSFLITIGDRTVGGYTVRDQMVGKWQVPVSDVAITSSSYVGFTGEAMSMGQKTSIATLNVTASVKMALAESITNISACFIPHLNDIKISANWMASCGMANGGIGNGSGGDNSQDAKLYMATKELSLFCQKLNIAIPVGKDSLSMKTKWGDREVISPVSLIVSAFAPVVDVRIHQTPQISGDKDTSLVLIGVDNHHRLGGSILQECYNKIGSSTPNIDDDMLFIQLFKLIQKLHQDGYILAYHDRSDGGLIATICEMIFVSRLGVNILVPNEVGTDSLLSFLFNEEIGVIIEVNNTHLDEIFELIKTHGLYGVQIGEINLAHDNLSIHHKNEVVFTDTRINLQKKWNEVGRQIKLLRDNPECVSSEHDVELDPNNTGLFFKPTFDMNGVNKNDGMRVNLKLTKPKVAILREQGVNGHNEMAAAFHLAGFEAYDVHMRDLVNKKFDLRNFEGMVACGGFSYGDVLGAGSGWAKSILFNEYLKDMFEEFFIKPNTFGLGVCNGCQMMTQLKELIPGASSFPDKIIKNNSEQFEARFTMVRINKTPSIFFTGMDGSYLPIVVSHGEGRAIGGDGNLVVMQYVDSQGKPTNVYPYNPNGTENGATAFCNADGRFTIMMPHPERIFRTVQLSWCDVNYSQCEYSPWNKIFQNAYQY